MNPKVLRGAAPIIDEIRPGKIQGSEYLFPYRIALQFEINTQVTSILAARRESWPGDNKQIPTSEVHTFLVPRRHEPTSHVIPLLGLGSYVGCDGSVYNQSREEVCPAFGKGFLLTSAAMWSRMLYRFISLTVWEGISIFSFV